MNKKNDNLQWFLKARFGMIVHFGLYSLLGRGEWVMNREGILPEDYRKLADRFRPDKFDADAICALAAEGGMQYIVFTTMHHDGFRLYDTALSDFSSVRTAARRDFVAEIIAAARKRGLKIGLYHSLNNWYDRPDGVAALENPAAGRKFIDNTFARIRELLTKYNPVDILWYDGWWPFNAKGWRAKEMNAMVSSLQPHILVNGRNGLPGDFGTPEGHMTAPAPWRPWEACMTLNDHWGYHPADHNWKNPLEVVKLLAIAASQRGNLLLNLGPRGDGGIPQESARIIREVGAWLRKKGGAAAIFDTEEFTFGYERRGAGRGDWDHNGAFTVRGKDLFVILKYFPGALFVLTGVQAKVRRVSVNGKPLGFTQRAGKVVVELPAALAKAFCPVLRLECARPPGIYRTGGMRVPRVPHPPYDPCPSDIAPH